MTELYRFRVTGTEDTLGTILRPYEDTGEFRADNLPEAILQLVHRELWWDTLDITRAITIEIGPVDEPDEPAT